MTDRLKKALRELTPPELDQLTEFAEVLAHSHVSQSTGPREPMKLDWAGSMKDAPYPSGLEAQEAAKHYRIFLLERGMPK